LFQAGVVVGADTGQDGDLFAPQAGDTSASDGGKADLVRADAGSLRA
jgi:hypothetical protein